MALRVAVAASIGTGTSLSVDLSADVPAGGRPQAPSISVATRRQVEEIDPID
jgi:hypothetical protein